MNTIDLLRLNVPRDTEKAEDARNRLIAECGGIPEAIAKLEEVKGVIENIIDFAFVASINTHPVDNSEEYFEVENYSARGYSIIRTISNALDDLKSLKNFHDANQAIKAEKA